MMQNTKVKKTGRGKRREWVLGVGLMAGLVGFVFRIPLSRPRYGNIYGVQRNDVLWDFKSCGDPGKIQGQKGYV